MIGQAIWLPLGASPTRSRDWYFGLYLPVSSADHHGPEQQLAVRELLSALRCCI